MEFQQLCTFDRFREVWSHYGYSGNLEGIIKKEFTRIKGVTYLDHAGATLYPESVVNEFCHDISTNVYGNPHSYHSSSRLTHDTVDRVRYRILQHFNTTSQEYSVIFNSGSTAALKLVAESFPWRAPTATEPGSLFCYLTDNHTSVVGIRGLASGRGVLSLPVLPQEVEARPRAPDDAGGGETPHLFCYPAQSNFSGRKYPLSHVRGIQERRLYPAASHGGRWFVLLDAASHASCSPLDLQRCPADFVPLSFYKMFGFPTGLGALLVRNEAAASLKKTYFGGGTAAAYLAGEDYFVPAANISDRFEDGTISFLDIVALNHSFEALQRITGGIHNIQLHSFGLARYAYMLLSSLRHGNGLPVATMYTQGQFESPSTQGAILNFNLLDCSGQIIGYSQVEKLASVYNIHLRTGCFCNTGACQYFLGITNERAKSNLQAGHVCGDSVDLVDGKPTGSVRVSFGYVSTFDDCQKFLKFVVDCFVVKPVKVDQVRLEKLRTAAASTNSYLDLQTEQSNGDISPGDETLLHPVEPALDGPGSPDTTGDTAGTHPYTLTNIYIYPIKSCAAYEVRDWPVSASGFLYDRNWMVVNVNGVCLSQKREPRLCLIQPRVHLSSSKLFLHGPGMAALSLPLENTAASQMFQRVCQSKVCGDRVQTVDCGDQAASWLSEFLRQPCRLIRQSPDFIRDGKNGSNAAFHQDPWMTVICVKSIVVVYALTLPGSPSTVLSLVNEAQYLMINRASVALIQDEINSRQEYEGDGQFLDTQNLISRFRANFVVAGVKPFEEDNWSQLIIGNTRFTVSGRCERCQMISVDQDKGTKTKAPLLALSACRKGKMTFGVYLRGHLEERSTSASTISVGSTMLPQTSVSSS